MNVPAEWIAEAGLQDFKPTRCGFHCVVDHELIALADIEPPIRNADRPLDANGFRHDRMLKILVGIRRDDAIPPIPIEIADPGQRRYRVRDGVHRYWASVTVGFTHIPAEVAERY
jgi:hypothetical protein